MWAVYLFISIFDETISHIDFNLLQGLSKIRSFCLNENPIGTSVVFNSIQFLCLEFKTILNELKRGSSEYMNQNLMLFFFLMSKTIWHLGDYVLNKFKPQNLKVTSVIFKKN
jgi:hypothetical protein